MMSRTVTIAGHKIPVMVLVAAAAGIGILLVLRARSKGTSVVSTGPAAAAASTAAQTYDPALAGLAPTYTQAGSVDYGSQLTALQAQISSLQGGQPGSAPAATIHPLSDFSGALRHGAGYYEGVLGDPNKGPLYAASGDYQNIDALQAKTLQSLGVGLYFQNAPGEFTQVSDWTKLPAGTGVYQLVHPPAGAAATTPPPPAMTVAPPPTPAPPITGSTAPVNPILGVRPLAPPHVLAA